MVNQVLFSLLILNFSFAIECSRLFFLTGKVSPVCESVNEHRFRVSHLCESMNEHRFRVSHLCESMNEHRFKVSHLCESLNEPSFAFSQHCESLPRQLFWFSQPPDSSGRYWDKKKLYKRYCSLTTGRVIFRKKKIILRR